MAVVVNIAAALQGFHMLDFLIIAGVIAAAYVFFREPKEIADHRKRLQIERESMEAIDEYTRKRQEEEEIRQEKRQKCLRERESKNRTQARNDAVAEFNQALSSLEKIKDQHIRQEAKIEAEYRFRKKIQDLM